VFVVVHFVIDSVRKLFDKPSYVYEHPHTVAVYTVMKHGRLTAGFSIWKPEIGHRAIQVEFSVDKVALGQFFGKYCGRFLTHNIPPILHTHLASTSLLQPGTTDQL
jgi:hypothetical protein